MFNDFMECPPKIFNDPLILNLGGHDVPQMKKSRENPVVLSCTGSSKVIVDEYGRSMMNS